MGAASRKDICIYLDGVPAVLVHVDKHLVVEQDGHEGRDQHGDDGRPHQHLR